LVSELKENRDMATKVYLYPVWIRLWHLLNLLLFLILIFTGISLQYVSDSGKFLISFEHAITWHNVAAFLLTANYVVYVLGNWFSGNGKYYRIKRKKMTRRLIKQFKFYAYGMFQGEEHPFPVSEKRKFNPLQKMSYILAMYLGMPLLIISGFGLLFPELLVGQFLGVSGLAINDVIHVTMGFILSVFMVVHIYTCTLGEKPGTLFKSMINGYHEEH
jgi:thiosulfate reductase cytochrome b subunit